MFLWLRSWRGSVGQARPGGPETQSRRRLRARSLGILFLALIVIDLLALEGEPLRGLTDHPFLAVGVVARGAKRIVGDHVVDEVCCAVIADLVGFTRAKKKRVACGYVAGASFMPHASAPCEDHVEFPLCRVRVVGAGRRARRDSHHCQIKGMSLSHVQRSWLASQGNRHLSHESMILALWGPYLPLGDRVKIDYLHRQPSDAQPLVSGKEFLRS